MAQETLLIEIGTEELPPKHLGNLSQAFSDCIAHSLAELGFAVEKLEHYASPRRLCAQFFNIPIHQPSRVLERRGPSLSAAFDPKGQPTQAALGFAKSCGVSVESLTVQETPQGSWLFCSIQEEGKSLASLLSLIIENALNRIPAVKRMRWGSSHIEFLRPIHWITVIHGTQAIPLSVFGLQASNKTRGHRVHFPQEIAIQHADNYVDFLRTIMVMVDHRERQKTIEAAINTLAQKNSGVAVIDEDLLDQVAGLVEWPVPLHAHFDPGFLDVPQEALISSMQNHQKCFPIKTSAGKLLPTFILMSNIEASNSHNIIQGNERVMHARLSDAKFFFDQDRKTPLSSRLEKLKNMVFQKKLGTLYDKSSRIAKLAGLIGKQIGAQVRLCERAGKICKADLLTEMVFEFPELQGTMGSYYAVNDGEPIEVATAIYESYLPRFAKDKLPESLTGIALALADRLDTLMGIFGIGQLPTGDRDPFALRRQALAILRILIEKELTLDLKELCQLARVGYGTLIDEEVVPQVLAFCFERFKAWYLEQGISPQTLEAVMANHPTQPFDCSQRVIAVNHFQTLPEAQNLAAANKRVKNILQKGNIVFSLHQLPKINPALFKENAEMTLFETIEALKKQTQPLIEAGHYQEALCALASLQTSVDLFFENVMVMTEDESLKENRIHLLCHLRALFVQIADVSRLAL